MIKINTAVLYSNIDEASGIHEHDCHQLVYYCNGNGTMNVNGKSHKVSNGTVVYIPPKTAHRDYIKRVGLQYISVLFDTDENLFGGSVAVTTDNKYHDIYNELRQVVIYNQFGEDSYTKIRDMLFAAACNTVAIYAGMDKNERIVHEYKTAIIENIGDADFTVNDFMNNQDITRSNVSRRFKAVTKGTTKNFFDEQKIEYAKQILLNDENDSITSEKIAKKCGYDEHYYFSRLFKQRTGMSISEFKNKK